MASGSGDKLIRLWDIITRREISYLAGHSDTIYGVMFCPSGDELISCSFDGTVRVWDISSPVARSREPRHRESVDVLAFDRDGTKIASGSLDGTARVWDLQTKRETVCQRYDQIQRLAIGDDGQLLVGRHASSHEHNKLGFEQKRPRTRVGGWAAAWAYQHARKWLATEDEDGSIEIWDPHTGQVVSQMSKPRENVPKLAFDPSGRRLISGSEHDKTVRVWDCMSGREVASFRFDHAVRSITCASDSVFAVGDWAGNVHILDLVDPLPSTPGRV